jgi:hypothetical protein
MSAVPALSLAEVTERAIDPALRLLPTRMDSPEARVLLLAIGLQESHFRYRRQLILVKRNGRTQLVPEGPAKSFWMGERGGGLVHGVRVHPATRGYAADLYKLFKVPPRDVSIWNAIENNDVLAAALARLLLFSDPYKLPALGHTQLAWELYAQRTWKPGKPRRDEWGGNYAAALDFVTQPQEM